jgi:H/ACA ribonucleoprotein complex subunit 4
MERSWGKKSVRELLEFGIINIDKPQNPTSFNVSDFVRKKLEPFGVRKTSHFGTLDPKVTGVLPIALNRACKLTGFFLGEDKEYVGIMRFHEEVSLDKVERAIRERFIGKIMQKPPVRSRVKRQMREREVKKFDILENDGRDFLFRAAVQGGTYIRKLVDDLGKEIGIGSHMLELRRVRAGIFLEKNGVNLYDFSKAVSEFENGNENPLREMIIPAEIVSEIYPAIEVREDFVKNLLTGKPLLKKYLAKAMEFKEGDVISAFNNDKFIGMYKVVKDGEIFAKPLFVLQDMK